MTTLLFTAHDEKYKPLAELTVPRMQKEENQWYEKAKSLAALSPI